MVRSTTSLEGKGKAMLNPWALQNITSKTKDTIIFEKGTGNIIAYYYEGIRNFPNVLKEDLGNIEDYCPGFLEAAISRALPAGSG